MAAKETGTKEVDFYGEALTVKPCVGSVIVTGTHYRRLEEETWERAEFRLPTNTNGPIKSFAVRVEVTGRKVQHLRGDRCVRVNIVPVGDGEPDGEAFSAVMLLQNGFNCDYKN